MMFIRLRHSLFIIRPFYPRWGAPVRTRYLHDVRQSTSTPVRAFLGGARVAALMAFGMPWSKDSAQKVIRVRNLVYGLEI